jgi:hypothetical protein
MAMAQRRGLILWLSAVADGKAEMPFEPFVNLMG